MNQINHEKINKLNQELILDRTDLTRLESCYDDEELNWLIHLLKNEECIRKPKRIESFDFEKSELIEGIIEE